MIKAVLFDLDGTLIDTNEVILKSFRHAFKTVLKLEIQDENITKMFGVPLEESFSSYTKENLEEVIKCYRDYNESIHDNMCTLFVGVKSMLDNLKKQGIKLGIVTSKRKSLAEKGLKICDILNFFDVIITPEVTTNHKPHKEPVEKACEMLKIDVKDTLMVGDSHYDLISGKSAGAKTCGVKYTIIPLDELKKVNPDYLIDKPLDILDIILKENLNKSI